MATATTDFDHAAHQAQLDEACAALDAQSDTLADLIRTGVWGEPEIGRFLARFADRPLVRTCLASFIDRIRDEDETP
jgi:hypothetical protein